MVSLSDPIFPAHDDIIRDWEDTRLYSDWKEHVVDGDNDFVIAVTPSSKTPVTGTGKTTLGIRLARNFDISDGGFDAEEKATLDAGKLAYKVLPEVEEGSAVIFDEAQGAPGTDSVNARRGMTWEALDAINGILANRDKHLTLIIIIQQLSMLDSSLIPVIDAWLLIRKSPQHDQGAWATHHKINTNDYDLQNPQPKTPGVEDLTWDALRSNDPDYRAMEAKKQEAKQKSSEGESIPTDPEDLPTPVRNQLMAELNEEGVKQEVLGNVFDLSQSQVSRVVNGNV